MRLEVTRPARVDIGAVLRWSEDRFGIAARVRYRALIEAGFELITLAEDPVAVRRVSADYGEVLLLHLRNCRAKVAGISRPRHFIMYRRPTPDLVVVARILHDAMDLPEHFTDS